MFNIVHNDETIDCYQLVALYEECGWNTDGFRTIKRTQDAMNRSLGYCVAYAKEDLSLIGFCRLIGDGIYGVQLVDLMVKPAYRKQGVAQQLVKKIISNFSKISKDISIMLVDGPGINSIYKSMGFSMAFRESVHYFETTSMNL